MSGRRSGGPGIAPPWSLPVRSAARPSAARRLAGPAAVAVAVALAGCQTTQELSAQRAREAPAVDTSTALEPLGRATPGVRVGRPVLLRGPSTSAVAVEVLNTGRRTLRDVPIGVRVLDGSRSAYTNRTAGLQRALLRLPVLRAGERVVWINDQLPVVPATARVEAAGGRARTIAASALPRLRVGTVRAGDDGGQTVARGRVVNPTATVQDDLTVFVVGRRRGRIVAAGTARIPRLSARGTSPFTAFLVGDARGATLRAAAPATTPKERASR